MYCRKSIGGTHKAAVTACFRIWYGNNRARYYYSFKGF